MNRKIEFLSFLLISLSQKLLPLSFWVLIVFAFDKTYVSVLIILCTLIHEGGHLFTLKLQDSNKRGLLPTNKGFLIKGRPYGSYRENILVYASGPLANLVASLMLLPFRNEYLFTFMILNLATAISNLLPVRGYDGYGILKDFFEEHEKVNALLALSAFSRLFIVSLIFLSLYFIGRSGGGYWIFIIFFLAFLSDLYQTYKRTKSENLRDF
jgi:hypothetical protein